MALYPQLTTIDPGTTGTQFFGQVEVAIFDDVTGLPANGDNMQVFYQQNINGSITNTSIIVSGLSYPVYSGLLRDTSDGYFTTFNITSYIPGVGIPPDPAADDLQITNILTTPESAIGAGDGTVTINATSSFPAITYSLDGVTYQSSNIFTGQASGSGTAYAKDTNGGLLNQPYTVGLLGNILVSDPTVDLGNGNLSRWNAAFNNIWFKYQRKDFEITSIIEGDSNIIVAVNGGMTNVKIRTTITSTVPGQPTITSPGDFVYIKTALYEGSFEVIAKTTGTLTLDTPFNSVDTVGFININSLRPYYKVQTVITFVDPITGKFNTIISNNYPFPDGHTNVDLQSFLQSLLRAQDYSRYNLLNYRDMQLSASYTIKYAEVWDGNDGAFAAITRPYYVLFAARQIQQLGGGNMQEFVPYPAGFQPAKWLTDFVTPVYNHLFPFDIGFIFSEYMVGLAPYYKILLYDINMQLLADQTVNDAFLLNEDGTFILQQDGGKFIIASQLLQAGIVEHVGLNRLLINFTPPALCWFFSVQLLYNPVSGSPFPLTIAQVCRIDQQTTDRQVYFRWIGLTGCWNYFTFVYNQLKTLEVSNTVTVKNFITDWQAADTLIEVISKNAGLKMTVFAENVSIDDINGIRGLKMSSKVQIYTGPSVSGSNWQTINSGDATYSEFETAINEYSVSVTFALPQINLQYQ